MQHQQQSKETKNLLDHHLNLKLNLHFQSKNKIHSFAPNDLPSIEYEEPASPELCYCKSLKY